MNPKRIEAAKRLIRARNKNYAPGELVGVYILELKSLLFDGSSRLKLRVIVARLSTVLALILLIADLLERVGHQDLFTDK